MLCPRCQSDNKPGQQACWNCLSPLDGALAQRLAQRPPDPATAAANAGAKKKGGAFWAMIGGFSFLLFVASLFFFWNLSKSTRDSLPPDAQALLPTAASTSTSTASTTGDTTAGAATAGTTTSGATTSGSDASSSDSSSSSSASSGSGNEGTGKGAVNAALKDNP